MNHLESTGSALAEDVIQKSEIIKSYYMENKAGGWVGGWLWRLLLGEL